MHLTLEQRIFIVESFGTHKSEVITLRSFQREFGIIIAKPRRVFKNGKKMALFVIKIKASVAVNEQEDQKKTLMLFV